MRAQHALERRLRSSAKADSVTGFPGFARRAIRNPQLKRAASRSHTLRKIAQLWAVLVGEAMSKPSYEVGKAIAPLALSGPEDGKPSSSAKRVKIVELRPPRCQVN